ncbi:hypothetical protein [Actinoplanes derwentensis]|uniref:Secreted protein n=1 Tax=Actinoplanes derwentensis TaxID=113562 RepID=A0A1H1WK63_9ACTN|nr:hypothetical protein [Actinoplanes derwentensis]SDS97382.1 hypothetical protein SAMN04489716_2132 [Actinoplanes derwentensis]
MTARPLIFLDVDGPLIPLRERQGALSGAPPDPSGHPLIHRLDPEVGRRLLALNGTLMWATTWMDAANEIVAPRLGLPYLPVVPFPDDEWIPGNGVHWKTLTLALWADGRPFVWLDDELTDADARWVGDHHPGPALLHHVDPFTGLTGDDFTHVERWLSYVADGPATRRPQDGEA